MYIRDENNVYVISTEQEYRAVLRTIEGGDTPDMSKYPVAVGLDFAEKVLRISDLSEDGARILREYLQESEPHGGTYI